MPVNRKAGELGPFDPDEVAMFWRVFNATKPRGETAIEAEHRASRIIATYAAGITDEKELAEIARRPLGR
jgi:hypothetical protein